MNSFFYTVGGHTANAVLSTKDAVRSAAVETGVAGSSFVAGYKAACAQRKRLPVYEVTELARSAA